MKKYKVSHVTEKGGINLCGSSYEYFSSQEEADAFCLAAEEENSTTLTVWADACCEGCGFPETSIEHIQLCSQFYSFFVYTVDPLGNILSGTAGGDVSLEIAIEKARTLIRDLKFQNKVVNFPVFVVDKKLTTQAIIEDK